MVHHDWFESLIQTTGMPVTDELRILLIETMFARLPLEHRTKLMARLDARMRRDFIRDLPIELSTRILSYLPLTDITQSVSLVSRQWWSVTRDRSLWHSLFLQQGWQLDMDRWAYYNTLPVEMNPDIVMLEQYSDTQQLQQSFVPMNRDTAMASRKKAMDRAWNAPGLPSSTNGHGLFDNPDSSFFEAAQQRRFRGKLYRRQPVINANFLPPLTDSPPRYLSPENLAPYESAPPIAPVDWLGMYKHQYQLETNWVHGNCKISRWPMAHTESIYCLQFDRHNRLFTGSRDHTIKVWYLADNSEITPLTTLSAHTGSVLTLQVDGDTLISGSSDATICVWDLKTQTVQHTLPRY
ncbi:hypothetical protein FBU59_002139 [Linderina macrospora]|uniref:Uncharacterized protein n=1 Tax=Linderina macrospora TaxID=4868 RepID=A0ACC1JBZ4_9FUNG|nr:hypothetical protein FBU59_002139 [Linderina macrospora]